MKNKYRHNPDGSTTIFIESPKYGTKEVLIDTDDFEKVNEYPLTWTLKFDNKKNGSKNTRFYVNTNIPHPNGGVYIHPKSGRSFKRSTTQKLHHAIMGKPAKGYVTDHINGNGLDNRKENLRLVTHAENNQNKRMQYNNPTGYVGVRKKYKNQANWCAILGRRTHLGTFKTKEEAAQAYDLAVVERRKIINPERQLNFPEKLKEYEALLTTNNKCEDKKYKKQ